MKKSKLIGLLTTFSQKEYKRLTKHIQRLHGKDAPETKLLEYLKSSHPTFSTKRIDKEVIIKRLYGDVKSQHPTKRLLNIASTLYQDTLVFLTNQRIAEDPFLKDMILLKILQERKLERSFKKQAESLRNKISENGVGHERFLYLHQISHYEYYYAAQQKIKLEIPPLANALKYLETYHQILKLKYTAEVNNRANLLNTGLKFPQPSFDRQIEIDRQQGGASMIEVFQNLVQLTIKPDAAIAQQLSNDLARPALLLSREDSQIILSYLINFYNSRFRQGDQSAMTKVFELYQLGLKKDLLIKSGFLSSDNFRNIVYCACEVEAFSWCGTFIEEYQAMVPESEQADVVALAKGRLAFGLGKLQEVLHHIRVVDMRDNSFKVLSKFLEVQTYYELDESYDDLLMSSISNFQSFLKRNKVLHPNLIDACNNFLQLVIALRSPLININEKQLKNNILATNSLFGKKWLLSKNAERSNK